MSNILSAIIIALIIMGMTFMMNSCGNNRNAALKCVANHILTNIEKEKIDDFIKLEGEIIWREGWGKLTSSIAEDNFVIEKCGIRQYIAQYSLSLEDIKGRMVLVYSVHSYLKYGKVNQDAITKKVDLYFLKINM